MTALPKNAFPEIYKSEHWLISVGRLAKTIPFRERLAEYGSHTSGVGTTPEKLNYNVTHDFLKYTPKAPTFLISVYQD